MHYSQEVKYRIASAKEAFNTKEIFCGPLDIKLRKRMVKRFVWRVFLYRAEMWTLRKEEGIGLQGAEMEKDGKDFLEGCSDMRMCLEE